MNARNPDRIRYTRRMVLGCFGMALSVLALPYFNSEPTAQVALLVSAMVCCVFGLDAAVWLDHDASKDD